MTARQSEQFRNYLALLFDDRKAAPGDKPTRTRRAPVKAYA